MAAPARWRRPSRRRRSRGCSCTSRRSLRRATRCSRTRRWPKWSRRSSAATASPLCQLRLEAADTLGREATAANAYELRPERLARIAAPVRFLLGTDTAPALQRSTRAAHEALPGSELVELPGEAHNAMDTHPEA